MNLISLLIGLGALCWAFVAFLPFLGALYWLVIPFALVGLAFGILSSHTSGRNLNLVIILIGFARLTIGGGLF